MAGSLKTEEMESFRETLENLRARLRGDLSQMTDEALGKEDGNSTGNLSNLPIHLADMGTDNYDQEFTLELIENEQGTLGMVNEALGRLSVGTFGQCVECGHMIAKPRLQAIPYARTCIECARKLESQA